MSAPAYLVLARKYRPRTFDEVTGQAVVTGVLRGALEEERVGHAYLFCGPRGTGKTTTARIFAKALNCERGAKDGPCNECERCLSADAGAEADLVEIDAASHTGVENVRDLRDQAAYAPMRARNKIFIIDEVHMLSRGAFNALLKTLEEPPPHVKFLFATTEPHKLPDTIVSRCQVLKLSGLSEADITGRLEEVSAAEGLTPEDGVFAEVARRARGGMRDALSLTDQLIALAGTSPTLADLDRLASSGGLREVDQLLTLVEAGDRAGVLVALDHVDGGETQLLDALLENVRLTLVAALCGADAPHLGDSVELRRIAGERAARLGADRLQVWLEELLVARDRLRGLQGHARLVVEMVLLGLSENARTLPLAELASRLVALEARLGGAPAAPPSAAPAGAGTAPVATPHGAAAAKDRAILEPAPRPEVAPAPRPEVAPAPRPEVAPASRPEVAPAPAAARTPAPARAQVPAPSPAAAAAPKEAKSAAPTPAPPAGPAAKPPAEPAAKPAAKPAARPARRDGRKSEPAARPATAADAWVAFLDKLSRSAGALAEILRKRGRIDAYETQRVVVALEGVVAADRRMLRDPRNQATCRQAFWDLLGADVEVTMEEREASAPRGSDEFTSKVADLFDGVIEESS